MTLTNSGRRVAAVAVLLLAAAVAFGYREMAVLALAGIFAVPTALAVLPAPTHLRATVSASPSRVQRGGRTTVEVAFRNSADRPTPGFRCLVPNHPPVDVAGLPAATTGQLRVELCDLRRGVHRLGPVSVRWNDPLGLAERRATVGEDRECIVHPRVVRLPVLTAARDQRGDSNVNRMAEGSLAFHSLRPYADGDEPRHIHWWASARSGELQVRRHVDPPAASNALLLDTRRRSYLAPEDFEHATDLAASLLVAAASRRLPVRLHITGGALPVVGTGHRDDRLRMLDALAVVGVSDPHASSGSGVSATLSDALSQVAKAGTAAGILTIVTGSASAPSADDELVAVARRALATHPVVVLARMGSSGTADRTGAQGGSVRVHDGLFVVDLATVDDAPSAWLELAARVGPCRS